MCNFPAFLSYVGKRAALICAVLCFDSIIITIYAYSELCCGFLPGDIVWCFVLCAAVGRVCPERVHPAGSESGGGGRYAAGAVRSV